MSILLCKQSIFSSQSKKQINSVGGECNQISQWEQWSPGGKCGRSDSQLILPTQCHFFFLEVDLALDCRKEEIALCGERSSVSSPTCPLPHFPLVILFRPSSILSAPLLVLPPSLPLTGPIFTQVGGPALPAFFCPVRPQPWPCRESTVAALDVEMACWY